MSMRQLKISTSITNRESQSLEKYLQEIGKLKMISADEEVALAIQIRNGDKLAEAKLIKANLRFVVSVAKQFQGQGLSLSDMINEGNVGLIKAAGRFDNTRGFKFISFAVWWIRQSILQSLAENSRVIRLPVNKVMLKNRVYKAHAILEQQLDRSPSSEEISDMLQVDLEEINQILLQSNTVSLDTPFSPGEEGSLLDTLVNTNSGQTEQQIYHDESLKMEIDRTMQVLTERQKETICLFYGIGIDHPLTLEDIGRKFDLTPERVRQIRDKGILKLRSTLSRDLLRSYL
jgi:RNA polymerase primary sigma factor